jgi:DNA helicase-2/ATP-dependent DNA helicase PcrA
VEDAFVAAGIPYRVVGGVRFYARMEVKDILAYLKALDNPADDVAVKRIINTPPRGIGNATVQRISELASEREISFHAAMVEAGKGSVLAAGARAKVASFAADLDRFRQQAATLPLDQLAQTVMLETGYLQRLKQTKSEEAQERLANLEELLTAMETFEANSAEKGLAAFLEQVALVTDLEEEGEGRKSSATLMTLHAAKGLEFPVVFMVGVEERLFPHLRALEDPEQMEEERRLCYVGMTRAQKRLFLLNVKRRHIFGQEQTNPPARFISEIPQPLLDLEESFEPSRLHSRDFGTASFDSRPFDSRPAEPGRHNLASLFEEEMEPEFENEVRVVPDEPAEGVSIGMRVRHGQFGVGTIRKIEGEGDNQKVIVWFGTVGPKKLLVRFAGLERA